MLGGEGSVAGDRNGGKEGWVQFAVSGEVVVLLSSIMCGMIAKDEC